MSFRFETPRGSVPRPTRFGAQSRLGPLTSSDTRLDSASRLRSASRPGSGSRLGSRDIDWRCVTLVMAAAELGAAFP